MFIIQTIQTLEKFLEMLLKTIMVPAQIPIPRYIWKRAKPSTNKSNY